MVVSPRRVFFKVVPTVNLKYLEKIFRSKVLTLLLSKGKITPDHINLLKSWRHSGFQVFYGPRILPRKKEAMENLARYIIRASFSQERMTYLPEPVESLKVERESRIIYRSKDNRQENIFDALDWSRLWRDNVSRGLRQKENEDALIPCVLEPDENAKPNRNWARLIQKIYEVDPLTCPKCQGPMRIISIIDDQEVINKILLHLGLWQTNQRPPPKPNSLKLQIDYSDSQLPFYEEAFDQDFRTSTDHSAV